MATNLARAARVEGENSCHLNARIFPLYSAPAHEFRIHIQLRNLPRTAIPSDIRRLVSRTKLQGVAEGA